jgi:merlin protein
MNEQLHSMQGAMKRTEETAELLSEKARVSEEEALTLAKRASEAEAECQRIRISQIKVRFVDITIRKSTLHLIYRLKKQKWHWNERRAKPN